ncbi:MAG: transglutaminase domain-containing protein [Lachnospiraceae bacterium]
MKKLHFDYYMRITYSETAAKCHYTIKCVPPDTDRQRLDEINIEIVPDDAFWRSEDSFGNRILYGSVDREHDIFCFHISGKVTTGMADYESEKNEASLGKYRYPFGLTRPGEGLQAYFDSLEINRKLPALERAVILMHRLYQDFRYEKNVTFISTTAEDAWKLGRGVCQDYAHILIVLCRLAGIPARYVAGMMFGEGYSHAWVEVFSEGNWYGLDPTNDCIVTASYIKLGVGREATDCAINRGIVNGGGEQTQEIRVKVEEMTEGQE